MLSRLLRFETKLQTRQVGFWIAALALFILSALVISSDSFSVSVTTGEKVKANGAITVAVQTGMFNLCAIFFGAVFVVMGVMRDDTHKTLEIIHATPVSTFHMTFSRIFGAYIVTYVCVFASTLGLFVGQFAPWLDKETIGPINLSNFLYPALVFSPINVLFVTAFFTLIAGLTRNRTLVYVSAIGLLMAYSISRLIVGENPPDWLGALADPFGINALAIETEYWPADEQNNRRLPVWGWVGFNRLVWGAVSILMLWGVFAKFKRGIVGGKTKTASSSENLVITDYKPAATQTGLQMFLSIFAARLGYEYKTTVKSTAFIVLVFLALASFVTTMIVIIFVSPEKVRPTSQTMASIAFGHLFLPMTIMTVLFGGEIMWRDRISGMHEIIDGTPAPNGAFLLAKWGSLILVILSLYSVMMIFAMIAQIFVSDIAVDLSIYLRMTYMGTVPDFIAYAILVMFLQNFMPNRVLGMLVSAGLLVFIVFFLSGLNFYHPLMGFGARSPGVLSEMGGYSGLTSFTWFNLYWGGLCGVLGAVSIWIWRRGVQTDIFSRLQSMKVNRSAASSFAAAFFAVIFLGSGGWIFKAYNIDRDYRFKKEREQRSADRETFFAAEFKRKVPKFQSVDVEVYFRPSKRTADVKGSLVIKNVHDTPITELYIDPSSPHKENVKRLDVKGAARIRSGENADGDAVEQIEDYGYYLYKFDPPLAPGAESLIEFDVYYHPPKLNDGSKVQRNGTFLNNTDILPVMGINDDRMRNPDKRRKYKLGKLEKRAEREDMEARQFNMLSNNGDYVDFKSKMCTDIDQIAISPGKLLREYEEDGQACRDYEAINPILNFFSFVSADFTVKKDVWKNPNGRDVEILVYYHDKHYYNVDLMIEAVKNAFDTYTDLYGPYRYHQMRILEIPYIGFAQAFAGTVPFSEFGFILDPGEADDPKSIDNATYVTLHEIAHQWFGHQIVPADVKGFNILSEGLAENAATTAYEAKYGWQKTRQMLEKGAMDTYLQQRAYSSRGEVPLALAEEQSYLAYQKSNWVFWGLKQYMGEDKMQGAIRTFLGEHGSKGPPYPTTKQLIEYLRAAAAPEYQQLITDYWDRVIMWDLKFGEADAIVTSNSEGGFKVTIPLNVDKKAVDEDSGKEVSVTEFEAKIEDLNEWIEIGFYLEDPKDTLGGNWLALKRIKVTERESEVSFSLKDRPNYILIDPRRLLIERDVKDNVTFVKD